MLCILYIRFRNVPKCPNRPPKAYGLSAAQSSTWEMKRWVAGAPEAFQRLGLEWLHRLAKNPSRIGRMMKLPLFLVHVAGEKGKKP